MTDSRTQELARLDQAHVWHPFTQMRAWQDAPPLIIERADGVYLIDTDGNRYLDGVGSLWVNVHGHRCARVDEAVRAQLDCVAHSTLLGLSSVPSIELAAKLAEVAPAGLSRVFYSDSGSTAVEVALKIAFQYWQQQPDASKRGKTRFLRFSGAYHGDTIGSVSVGGIDLFHSIYKPLLFDTDVAEYPHPYRAPDATPEACRDRCLAELDQKLTDKADTIAAVVIEPLVQGAAGMVTAPEGFLAGVAERCRAHDVLLIADEVATGFGRTGRLFACEHEGVAPDLLCLAKGITAGYLPLAATLVTERIFDAFLGEHTDLRTFFHGHTYTGNPLACAAALANLEELEQSRLLERLPDTIAQLDALLAEHVTPLAHVGDVRGRGMMRGIELVSDRASKGPFPFEQRTGGRVCDAARSHGVILRPLGDVITLMPPLVIGPDDLARLIEATAAAIREVTEAA